METQRVRAWIFDIDHTLYPPSTKFVERVFEAVFEYVEKEHALSRSLLEKSLSHAEEKGFSGLEYLERKGLVSLEEFSDIVMGVDISNIPSCNETVVLLNSLSGVKVACTNSPLEPASRMLSHLGMENAFDVVSSLSCRNGDPKPNLSVYKNLSDDLKIPPEACMMIDDHHKNLKPAHELGMQTVLIHPEARDVPYITTHYDTILDFLKAAS